MQPDPEAKPLPGALRLDARQQLVNHARRPVGVHRGQGPASFAAAPSGLPEGPLLEEDGVTSVRVADCVSLCELDPRLLAVRLPQPLASAPGGRAHQQPQRAQEPRAAAAAPAALLHPPPIHLGQSSANIQGSTLNLQQEINNSVLLQTNFAPDRLNLSPNSESRS